MAILKKRRTAALILVVVIFLSIIVGSYRSLNSVRSKITGVFNNGADGSGLSISNDLTKCAEAAYNLTVVASRYMDSDHDLITAVKNDVDALENADSISDKYSANSYLQDSAYALYLELGNCKLSENDAKYRLALYSELTSRSATMSHDEYNNLAQNFNDNILTAFPASIFASLFGITPLEIFR